MPPSLPPPARATCALLADVRFQPRFLLHSLDGSAKLEGGIAAGVIGAGAAFQGDEPVDEAVAHYFLDVTQWRAEIKRVVAFSGLEDGESPRGC